MKAILFDVYGTLISTGNGSVSAAGEILKRNGCDIPPAEFYAEWKMIHKRNMRSGGSRPESEIFEEDLKELFEIYDIGGDHSQDVKIMLDSLYDRKAFPETADVVRSLKNKYKLIIASNTDTAPLMQNLGSNRLEFDSIFTSQSLKCYKPDPDFYLKILEDLHLTADEVIFVGDSPEEDILAPLRLGIKTVFVDRKDTGRDHGQDRTIKDLSGLENAIEDLEGAT